ncbi:MAG: DUF4838 domain-containing protein [Kiritimatiellia bacterium]
MDEYLAANYPVHKSVSISPPDTSEYCHCDDCLKLVKSDEAHTSAVLYIDLVNYVATTLLPKYPKAHFNLLSYGASYTPPRDTKRFRMGPGTGVAFAHHWRNHGIPINCCERFMPRFLGWREVCDRFLFWEYYTNFRCYLNPFPNTDILGPAFKFYLDNKFDGGFCQMTNSRLTPFADLNWWVKNRLMWNPDADSQALVEHYIEGAYGVYDFIESFGVVFCAPEYEYIPTTNLLAIAGDYAKVDAPVFEWRSAWGDLNNNACFALKHRIHTSPGSDIWKTFGPRLPFNISQGLPGGWFPWKAKFWEKHPEWYSYNRAKKERYHGWICPSNEGMYQQLFKEVEAWIQKNPGRQVSLGVSDGARMCECDQCQALERKYPELNGSYNSYIQMIEVVNRVARHFAKKYPDVTFNFLCYGDLMPTNPDYKLEPNVGAGEAELWRNHCLSADNNERSERSLGQLTRITPNAVYVWDYLANFSNYMIPFPNHNILGQTLRYYDRLGVKGVDSQTAFGIISDMSTLNFYLFGKLHWNPYLDERAITEKYVNAAYGDGARWVMEYLDILEHARLRQRFTWYGCYVPTTDHYLTGDDCVKIQRAFDNADRALRRDPQRRLLLRRARIAALLNPEYKDKTQPALPPAAAKK